MSDSVESEVLTTTLSLLFTSGLQQMRVASGLLMYERMKDQHPVPEIQPAIDEVARLWDRWMQEMASVGSKPEIST